ncbi:large subunit ribosomal protein L33 [Parelusimicrobium proximum]|uniref:50S ribosomal protein L33 n=1 Tax=Parelusimicrobium proximum TaxID=3228953 RepID=UPI003D18655B
MASNERQTILLACTVCKNKNYYYARGKKKDYKLEKNKFCKTCGKATPHKEGKA